MSRFKPGWGYLIMGMIFEHIPFSQCKHNGLYLLRARNLFIGVYNEKNKEFMGIRTKWGERFLDCEYHYDAGTPYDTANPIEFLEDCPFSEDKTGLFAWLEQKEEEYRLTKILPLPLGMKKSE